MFKSGICLVGIAVFTLLGSTAFATFIPGESDTVLKLIAEDDAGNRGVLDLKWGGEVSQQGEAYKWTFNPNNKAGEIWAGDVFLGELTEASVKVLADPEVEVFFGVKAPSAGATFTVQSAGLPISPAMNNPDAYATASITLTDVGSNGATLTGLEAGGKVFEARYNTTVAWADLVNGLTALPGTSITDDDRKPALPTQYQVIPASVSEILSEFKFKLSGGDIASGTGTFVIVPEPSTIILMLLGLAGLIRRR